MASNATSVGEYEFVEEPSRDFFCPVTFELLIDPVQTNFFCGNHLSRAVAEQLQAEGKPCPENTAQNDRRSVFQAAQSYGAKSAGCQWQVS